MMFITPMIQAIEDDRKRVTRRIIKPQPPKMFNGQKVEYKGFEVGSACFETKTDMWHIKPPCRPGDAIWCRETWSRGCNDCDQSYCGGCNGYIYKAKDYEGDTEAKWRPSIHMPREAARLFFSVKDVHPEKLQDITEKDAIAEGVGSLFLDKIAYSGNPKYNVPMEDETLSREQFELFWNFLYAAPKSIKKNGIITHYESYPWEDVQEILEYKGKPWIVYGNPWVWRIAFERKVRP